MKFRQFFVSVVGGAEWWAWYFGCCVPGTHRRGDEEAHIARLNVVAKIGILPLSRIYSRSSSQQSFYLLCHKHDSSYTKCMSRQLGKVVLLLPPCCLHDQLIFRDPKGATWIAIEFCTLPATCNLQLKETGEKLSPLLVADNPFP